MWMNATSTERLEPNSRRCSGEHSCQLDDSDADVDSAGSYGEIAECTAPPFWRGRRRETFPGTTWSGRGAGSEALMLWGGVLGRVQQVRRRVHPQA